MINTVLADPRHKWSVEAFRHYWKAPYAPRAMPVTADVVGYWPHPIGVVRGADDYISVIATILEVCPDFRLTVAEHAATGDFAFLRWIATGTGPDGGFEFDGCDRVQTRDGHVCENYIFCDDPFFARVAAEIDRGDPRVQTRSA
jgi:SnoaL-like domain